MSVPRTTTIFVVVVVTTLCMMTIRSSTAFVTNRQPTRRISFANTLRVQESLLFSTVSQQRYQQQPTTSSVSRSSKKQTPVEQEFHDMISTFTSYTEEDIQSIPNPRLQVIYRGVAASAEEPAVYRSFQVLFEDFVPLRLAGRMIFGTLKNEMDESIVLRQDQVTRLMQRTGLEEAELRNSRLAFMSIAKERNGKAVVTKEVLVDAKIAEAFVNIMNLENQDEFFKKLDGKEWNFEQFMLGLQQCTDSQSCSLVDCNPSTVLQEALVRMPPRDVFSVDPRKQKYSERYDNMVTTFKQWKAKVPTGEGRRLDILRGCFVGAENEQVVGALKICYVDYSALRVGGDLIFKLMTALVNGSK